MVIELVVRNGAWNNLWSNWEMITFWVVTGLIGGVTNRDYMALWICVTVRSLDSNEFIWLFW